MSTGCALREVESRRGPLKRCEEPETRATLPDPFREFTAGTGTRS